MKKKKKIFLLICLSLLIIPNPILAMKVVKCGGIGGVPYVILRFIGRVINIIKLAVPIMLIIMGILDMAKATTSNNEKKMQTSTKMLIKRTIYAVLVFFVIAIVQFIFKVFETSVSDTENDLLGCVSCVLGNDCKKEEFESGVSKSDTSGNAGGSNNKTVKVTSVVITSKKTSMTVGDTYKIAAKAMPNNATNKKLTYKSSKTAVATISGSGKITAKKAGTTTITVTSVSSKSKKETFKLTVKKKEAINNYSVSSGSIGGFTYYNQGDYSNVGFCGSGKTLQSSGCGAVTFAMVASNLVDSSYNPKAVANWLCSNGHSGGALSVSWYTKKKFLNKFGLNSVKIFGDIGTKNISSAKKKITNELNNNKMIILYIPGHYVTLAKGDNNKVILLDPGKRANNGTYTIDKVYEITKNYKNRCSSSGNCGWHGAYSFSKK